VLKPETIATILSPRPAGVGYGFSLTNIDGVQPVASGDYPATAMMHHGGNPGWTAHFLIDTTRRQGFVVANNSSVGFQLDVAVQKLWLKTTMGLDAGDDPDPEEGITGRMNRTALKIALALEILLFVAVGWCILQIARGKRHQARPRTRRVLLIIVPPVLATLLWWYVFYASQTMPLPISPSFPSLWTLPFIHYGTILLVSWICVAILFALLPRRDAELTTLRSDTQTAPGEPQPGLGHGLCRRKNWAALVVLTETLKTAPLTLTPLVNGSQSADVSRLRALSTVKPV